MEEEDADVKFFIEEFLDNLDSAEEEDAKMSEEELEEDETYDVKQYQENKIVSLREENFLLTDLL